MRLGFEAARVESVFPSPPEDLLDTARDGKIKGVGDTEEAFGCLKHVGGENLSLGPGAQPNRREIKASKNNKLYYFQGRLFRHCF